ncbi:hypothetical protein F4Z98_06050 [Candidatus Poribacteria bacterium]|nr:hypothetical protein [Candidatus Poribacteria bacterium]MYB01758.1 hypothetical protein [Candidatus Poribacteria bacterium]
MPEHIGNIGNLISKKKTSAPKRSPSRIKVLEGHVAALESTLKTVLCELTALREEVQRLRESACETKAKPQNDRKLSQPWDDPETLEEIEACRLRVLKLFDRRRELSKQACVDVLEIPLKLASWTLAFMTQVTKEVALFSLEATPTNPTPKKVFRLKT